MYAFCVACCPLVSHGEYADGTDRRTDGRTDAIDRYIAQASIAINNNNLYSPSKQKQYIKYKRIKNYKTKPKTD